MKNLKQHIGNPVSVIWQHNGLVCEGTLLKANGNKVTIRTNINGDKTGAIKSYVPHENISEVDKE